MLISQWIHFTVLTLLWVAYLLESLLWRRRLLRELRRHGALPPPQLPPSQGPYRDHVAAGSNMTEFLPQIDNVIESYKQRAQRRRERKLGVHMVVSVGGADAPQDTLEAQLAAPCGACKHENFYHGSDGCTVGSCACPIPWKKGQREW